MTKVYLLIIVIFIAEMTLNQLTAMLNENHEISSIEELPINEIKVRLARRNQNELHRAVLQENHINVAKLLAHSCCKSLVHKLDCCKQTPLILAIDVLYIAYDLYKRALCENKNTAYMQKLGTWLQERVLIIKLLIKACARISIQDALFLSDFSKQVEKNIRKSRNLTFNEPLPGADVVFLNKLTIWVPDSLIIIREESTDDVIEINSPINQLAVKKDPAPFYCTCCSIL